MQIKPVFHRIFLLSLISAAAGVSGWFAFPLRASVKVEGTGDLIPFSDRSRDLADTISTDHPPFNLRELPSPSARPRSDRAIDTVLKWADLPRATQDWSATRKRALVEEAARLPTTELHRRYPQLNHENLTTLRELVREASPE